MCGIAGYIDLGRPPGEETLRAMERALSHRGPDEGSIWQGGPCGLVHRRLRIIDLSPAAAQPMPNEDATLWVVFNGEIYNYRPLREELLKLGHRFKSRSDTEVILHGYESWGCEVFARLRGMFAIALWDIPKQQVVLARDRLGKKPLFYAADRERLVFGSELPVFKCIPGLPLRISTRALAEYVEFGYVQSPASILEGIQRLPAGSMAVWGSGLWRHEPFWTLPEAPAMPRCAGSAAEAATALEQPLADAVRCRLESDVPLGCFLSGGIDSSLVAALAHKSLSSPLKTYTVGFKDSVMDESVHARKIAEHLGTEHHELMVSGQSMLAEFEDILARAPEPIGDDSFVPTFLISRETRRHVTVALSGDGGDELFAGYDKYRQFAAARRLKSRVPLPWGAVHALPLGDRFQKSAEALSMADACSLARWLSSLWKRGEVRELLAVAPPDDQGPDAFDRRWGLRETYTDVERWMLTDMETYLEGDILTKVDRASMAVGLETRSPFLDSEFIGLALGWACRADPAQGGKNILRKLLARHVPEALFLRPKHGFGLPVAEWFRGALRPLLERQTAPNRLGRQGLFNAEPIARAVAQHLSGRRNFARKLHAIVAFEVWAERFFGADTTLG
jgi:asparagine synthase (glutamine-hydrolysing)